MERSTIHLLRKRGKSQRAIARELGRSRTTVARALIEPVDCPAPRRRRAKLTDPYRAQIATWLQAGLTAVRMFELAREDPAQPYPGQLSVFRAAVRQERRAQAQARAVADVPVRFEGLPAEYLQVDWGEIRRFPFTRQPPATRYFLGCRRKYSRWTWVRFTDEMRQETLFRGLVDCFQALGWVPWVLVFDNMKTVTTGRDTQDQPIWHPSLLQLAAEFDFHPEACWPGAGNQKGSVESLVKWVKGNFLPGRVFADDADLAAQNAAWLEYANTRASQATDVAPVTRLGAEAAQGGVLPATAADYGFAYPSQVSAEALVAVLGNRYSVPVTHVGAPVIARVHRAQIVRWRDAERLATHARAPDGTHQRVVDPAHFAPLFGRKPRAQVMLYRAVLLGLSARSARYVSAVSQRQLARLGDEIRELYRLYEQCGAAALLAAMDHAAPQGAYGAATQRALHLPPPRASAPPLPAPRLPLADVPAQAEIDRALSTYEVYVCIPDGTNAPAAALVRNGEGLR
jgi:transposase